MSTHAPFKRRRALAYFLTWTTYGTWLPGEDRGWHRKGEPEVQPPPPSIAEMARSRMKEKEFTLSHEHRRLVERTIRRHCELRRWALHAVNARTSQISRRCHRRWDYRRRPSATQLKACVPAP